jgi:hypothetical protein
MWMPYSDDEKHRFAELAALLMEARAAFHDVASATQWRAVPGSDAARDQEALASRTPALPENGQT